MTLELQLVKNHKVLFSVPIRALAEDMRGMALEIDEDDIEKLASLYSMAANERRLRVMLELMRHGEMTFSELLQVALNPKLVQDCLEPMVREGMLIHEGRGSSYRPSDRGAVLAITMTAGFAKLLDYLEEEEDIE